MPAAKQPKGTIPETKVEAVRTDPATVADEVIETKAAEQVEETELDDLDLKEVGEKGKIPYQRFQQVNEKAKKLERQMADLSRKYDEDVRRALLEKDVALQASRTRQEESVLDIDAPSHETKALKAELADIKNQLANISGTTKRERLKTEIKELSHKYPEADDLAVLGWAQNQPGADLEEMMEFSHNKNVERVEKSIQGIIEKKKAKKSQASVTSKSSGFSFKVDEKDKPKTVEDAGKMLKRFFGG